MHFGLVPHLDWFSILHLHFNSIDSNGARCHKQVNISIFKMKDDCVNTFHPSQFIEYYAVR